MTPAARIELGKRASRDAMFVALGAHVVACLYVVASRIGFDGQIEWMTGSILDHVERARAGESIYIEPGAGFIPYIYPPLYYWIGAMLGGSALACRLVSVASAATQAYFSLRIARQLDATRTWAAVAAGAFFASYSYAGWWYDIERSDTLYGAMALAVCSLVIGARTAARFAAAGALIGLAFLAKQQAVFFAAFATLGILLSMRARERTRLGDAMAFAAAAGVVLVAGLLVCARLSPHWFVYYVLEMPRAHGVTLGLLPDILGHDLLGIVLVAATFASLGITARRERHDRRSVLFASFLLAASGAALSSRLHIGGWINVLSPWCSFAAIALAVLASRATARAAASGADRDRNLALLFPWAIVLHCVLTAYDPGAFVPQRGMQEATTRFHDRVRALEAKGEVLLVSQGHITRERHFQMSGLADVFEVEGHSPPELVAALHARRYAAILDDARLEGDRPPAGWPPVMLEDVRDLRDPLFASYFVSERLDDALVGLPMIAPAMPRWIMLPRTRPLDGVSSEALSRRHWTEMRLAETRAKALHEGRPAPFTASEIEALAASSSD